MGLTLNYELQLPGSVSALDATAKLVELREFALTQSYGMVSPYLSQSEMEADSLSGQLNPLQHWASVIEEPLDDADTRFKVDATTAHGFFVCPGEGCEPAVFGLLKRAHDDARTGAEWYWACCCKTQYASQVSEDHFVACHTQLVALLDHAVQLGIGVLVEDEGQFWDTRNEAALRKELRSMNHLMAAFAGNMSDALGPKHKVQAAIFEHPRFEHLEMGED